MWRLAVLLCAGMFLVLLIGGQDRGQLRPGLAAAEAERAANGAQPTRTVERAPVLVTADERAPPPTRPVAAPEAPPPPAPEPAIEEIAVEETVPEPPPPVTPPPVTPTQEPAPQSAIPFSVGLGVEPPPPAPVALPAPDPPTPPAEETATPGGQILYVSADAVNVREGASTDAPVLGRLTRGEPAAVLWVEGTDWLRIEALNSGLEGFVARRFLSDQP